MTPPRVGFLLPHYSRRSNSLMPQVVQAVADLGARVDVIHPIEQMVDLSSVRVEHDLYVLRQTSRLALSLAGALHEQGARIVNPYPVSCALRDKVVASRVLQAAGVPIPMTVVASEPEQLAPMLEDGPIVIKPYQGGGGHHIRVVSTSAELANIDCHRDPVFAQRYHPHDGRDRKLYVIGGRVFGVKKVFPRRTEEEKVGEPFTPSVDLCEIARRSGLAFGIDLYGVDVIESQGNHYVVDMCSIPGFKGVPGAVSLLARHFYAAAQQQSVRDHLQTTALR